MVHKSSLFPPGLLRECSDLTTTLRIGLRILSSMLAPEIWTDWDSEIHRRNYTKVGRGNYYTSEWVRVRREYGYLTIIYSLENILLSLPLLYTCARLMHRHTILTPLDIEWTVIISAYFLIFFIPGRCMDGTECRTKKLKHVYFFISVFFTVIGIMQFKLFVFYNKKGHPWSRLLANEEAYQEREDHHDDRGRLIIPHLIA